jgi:pimeloyl-ACP methyl ester carboxylesterase
MFLSRHLRVVRPLVEDGWTAWVVTRRQHIPQGYSIADMADDYAQLIADDLGGRVRAAVGISTGGMIGIQLAARHPHHLGRIAVVAAGYVADGPRCEGDLRFAQLLHDGRTAEAIASMFGDAFPDVRVPGAPRVAGALLGPLVLRGAHASFLDDVLIEAEAERAFDARAILPGITIPVLLACGGEDQIFRREVVEETARLIPDCTLVIYEGRDHVGGVSDERLPTDVFEFIVSRSPSGPEARGTEPLPATA